MKITADRKTLLTALNSVSVALSSKAGVPFGGFVLLSVECNKMTLACDSIQVRAEATVECEREGEKPLIAMVSHAKLSALLQRDSVTTVLSNDDDRLKVQVGDLVAQIPLMAADGFPNQRDSNEQIAFVSLEGKTFGYAMAIACGCAGDGLTHRWNAGVLIQDDGKNLTIAAGDGKKFSRIAMPSSDSVFQTVLPAEFARSITSTLSASESLTMFVFNKYTHFVTENLTLTVQAMDVPYSPDVLRVCAAITTACKHEVQVDRAQLLQSMQTGAAMLDSDDFGLSFRINSQPQSLVTLSKSKSNGEYQEEIPLKVEVALPRRRINHKHIIAHLRALDCEEVVLHYASDNQTPCLRITPVKHGDWSFFMPYMLPLEQ